MAEEYEEDPSLLENEEDVPLRFKGAIRHLGLPIIFHLSDSRIRRGMTYANATERTLIIQTEPYRIVSTALVYCSCCHGLIVLVLVVIVVVLVGIVVVLVVMVEPGWTRRVRLVVQKDQAEAGEAQVRRHTGLSWFEMS